MIDHIKSLDISRDRFTWFELASDIEESIKHIPKLLIGFFGETGVGKSTLINYFLGFSPNEPLIPKATGTICTANPIITEYAETSQYEAIISFMSEEKWREFKQQLINIVREEEEKKEKEEEKDQTLYRSAKMILQLTTEGKEKNFNDLKEVRDSLQQKKILIKKEKATDLYFELLPYIIFNKHDKKQKKAPSSHTTEPPLELKALTLRG
jgi:ABC-type glutathione transport system ATPase component